MQETSNAQQGSAPLLPTLPWSSRWSAPAGVGQQIGALIERGRTSRRQHDIDGAWRALARAHVLSQPWAGPHVRVHLAMLRLGVESRSLDEVVGQIFRLLVAAPGSITGRYPTGNSGRSNVSAFAPAELPNDLHDILAEALQESSSSPGVLSADEVRSLYDLVAPVYDIMAKPYEWLVPRALEERVISELRLSPGDTVVDLGTGTGRNLVPLANTVGEGGHVIGVDISPKMLARARRRCERAGLRNVTLVEADLSTYSPPSDTSATVATFALEMPPDYDDIIDRMVEQLPPDGRIVLVGLREPERWPEWIIRFASLINRPLGVSSAYRDHRPWLSIQQRCADVLYEEYLTGAVYLAAGSPAPRGRSR